VTVRVPLSTRNDRGIRRRSNWNAKNRNPKEDSTKQPQTRQLHAQYYRDVSAPETKEAFGEIAGFFDKYLGK
jgi:hypothetical protein